MSNMFMMCSEALLPPLSSALGGVSRPIYIEITYHVARLITGY